MFTDRPARDAAFEWDARTIRALRTYLGWSQSVLARDLGIRQQTVSEWETGMYRPRGASVTILSLLARTAGFDPSAARHLTEHERQEPAPPARVVSGIGLMDVAAAAGSAGVPRVPGDPSNSVSREPAYGPWRSGTPEFSDDSRPRRHTESHRHSPGEEVPM